MAQTLRRVGQYTAQSGKPAGLVVPILLAVRSMPRGRGGGQEAESDPGTHLGIHRRRQRACRARRTHCSEGAVRHQTHSQTTVQPGASGHCTLQGRTEDAGRGSCWLGRPSSRRASPGQAEQYQQRLAGNEEAVHRGARPHAQQQRAKPISERHGCSQQDLLLNSQAGRSDGDGSARSCASAGVLEPDARE